MRMQTFRVKKPSCKILKTKNCVPFEVQYISSALYLLIMCGFVRLLQRRYLASADTGWSLQILFPDYNFIGSASKDGSILTT